MFKKTAAGFGAAAVLLGGGTLTADQLQNPYDQIGTTLQIEDVSTLPEAGTQKVILDTTKPKMTMTKWNGEVAMGVSYEGIKATGARKFLSKQVDWSDAKQTMEVVPLDKSAILEDGGYEINIVLKSKPTSNIFTFTIDGADQLDFFYQPALSQQEIAEGASRPDNVVGSYAVYYKDHANHIEGRTNYATGKAYHIYRPFVTDAKGNTVWADLAYSAGVLTVTVPQSFIDSATYPVKVDPTFGYTTHGASSNQLPFGSRAQAAAATGAYTSAGGETVTAITVYGNCFTAGSGQGTINLGIYDLVAGVPTNLKTSGTISFPSTSPSELTVTVSLGLSAATVYNVAFAPTNAGPSCNGSGATFYNDTSASSYVNSTGATLSDPWVTNATISTRWSIYATYSTAAASTAIAPTDTSIMGATGYIKGATGYIK